MIEKRSTMAGLKNLADNENADPEAVEIRLWYVFSGTEGIEGFVLAKTKNGWDGKYLPHAPILGKSMRQWEILPLEPTRPWTEIWKDMVRNGVLNPPAPEKNSSVDGFWLIVEIREGRRYRFYDYNNPLLYPKKKRDRIGRFLEPFNGSIKIQDGLFHWRTW